MRISLLFIAAFVIGCGTTSTEVVEKKSNTKRPAFVIEANKSAAKSSSDASMNNSAIDETLRAEVGDVEGEAPVWQFEYRGVKMAVFTDQPNDRMRIVAPILPVEDINSDIMAILMEANFHTALDARYATSDGVVYSTFIHPLSSLTDDDFRSALKQVSSLVLTFGTTFSSGSVGFTK